MNKLVVPACAHPAHHLRLIIRVDSVLSNYFSKVMPVKRHYLTLSPLFQLFIVEKV